MIIAGLILLGLCLGSFINALVYRLHWQETNPEATKAQKQRYSIKNGRSICPHCQHELASRDLIPVFSWFLLRGECRYCQKPISWQYPAVEALTPALFVASYAFWPGLQGPTLETAEVIGFVAWLVILVGLIALIVYDLRYMLLPNRIIFPLIILASLSIFLQSAVTYNLQPITSAAIGAAVGGGLFYILFQISNGAWIGGGDVKLGFLLGILIGGPWPALLMLFLASFLGSAFSIPMVLKSRLHKKSKIAFGPFLITAAIVMQLFGDSIIDWYYSVTLML